MFIRIEEIINTILHQFMLQENPWQTAVFVFKNGGWIAVVFALFWGLKEAWLYWRQHLYILSQKYVLLAIDVPRENEQGPKAIENLFSQIHGAYKSPDLIEKYLDGYLMPKFSFELISAGGYLQFLVWTAVQFRDLTEAAIYAQYPDAEITEVEDYAKDAPSKFKGTENDMWGCEFVLYNDDFYPIRTYPGFEYGLTQEFKDPMASLTELMSKISPDENIWLQLVITPVPPSWTKKGLKLVKELIGAKVPEAKPGFVYGTAKAVTKNAWEIATASLVEPKLTEEKKNDQQLRSQMLYLSPGERTAVEAVESKISKNAFETRFRFIYWGKKPAFSKPRGVNGIQGAIAQINSLDLNGFKSHPKTKVSVDYFFEETRKEWRRKRLMAAYKSRTSWAGWGRSILNIEELATLWHFPMRDIRTPMLKKTQSKRVESPFALPIEGLPTETQAPQDSGLASVEDPEPGRGEPAAAGLEQRREEPEASARVSSAKKESPPSNLPVG